MEDVNFNKTDITGIEFFVLRGLVENLRKAARDEEEKNKKRRGYHFSASEIGPTIEEIEDNINKNLLGKQYGGLSIPCCEWVKLNISLVKRGGRVRLINEDKYGEEVLRLKEYNTPKTPIKDVYSIIREIKEKQLGSSNGHLKASLIDIRRQTNLLMTELASCVVMNKSRKEVKQQFLLDLSGELIDRCFVGEANQGTLPSAVIRASIEKVVQEKSYSFEDVIAGRISTRTRDLLAMMLGGKAELDKLAAELKQSQAAGSSRQPLLP